MHGMSNGSGTVFWGGGNEAHDRGEADSFINDQVQAARKAQSDWVAN